MKVHLLHDTCTIRSKFYASSLRSHMNDILVTIDDDEKRARAHAEEIRNLFGSDFRAHILHVFHNNPEGASITNFAAARPVEKCFEEQGVEITFHERSGDPATQIVDVANEIDVDLITIAGRKRSPTGKLLFGSVAQDVILSTPRSVLVCDTVSEQ